MGCDEGIAVPVVSKAHIHRTHINRREGIVVHDLHQHKLRQLSTHLMVSTLYVTTKLCLYLLLFKLLIYYLICDDFNINFICTACTFAVLNCSYFQ